MIIGAKKQKGGQQKPNIQKDTTASNEFVQALYGLAEGEIAGPVRTKRQWRYCWQSH